MPNLGRGRVGACQQKTLGDRSSLCNNGTGQATSHPPSSLVSQRHPRPLLFCLPCSQGKDLSHVGLDFPASIVPFLSGQKCVRSGNVEAAAALSGGQVTTAVPTPGK